MPKTNANDRQPSGLIHPFTFSGVAGFSDASWTRLFIVQGIVALMAAGIAVWFVVIAWDPVIRSAIEHLPEDAEIRGGVLAWRAPDIPRLSHGKPSKFLSFEIVGDDAPKSGGDADFQFEFARTELRLRSFLGYFPVAYPSGWLIGLNRLELEPWWGAWRPAVFAGVGVMVVIGLFCGWAVLATIYSVLVRAIATYVNRDLSWSGAWRLSAASLMPGALFLSIVVGAYGLQQIGVLQLIVAFLLHFAVAWVYLIVAPFRLARVRSRAGKNPFALSARR